MIDPAERPVLTVYRREGCHLCDDARGLIQAVLEDRVRRGEAIPVVREIDIDADAELRDAYAIRIPVLALGGIETDLVTSTRQISALLDRAMPQVV